MECKIEKNKKREELKKLKRYSYQLLVVFLGFGNTIELKCENKEKAENRDIKKQEKIEIEHPNIEIENPNIEIEKTSKQGKEERKKLSNIKFSMPENIEILPQIKEIKTLKINESQYTIFRLKNGGRVVTRGNGNFIIAGEKYKINKVGDEVEIEDNSGAKIVVGGEE